MISGSSSLIQLSPDCRSHIRPRQKETQIIVPTDHRQSWTPLSCRLAFGALAAAITAFPIASAWADFKLCNATSSRLGVAIGYQDDKGWATEGWWNIPSQSCETLLKVMPSRYLYVHAVDYDRSGEWGAPTLCAPPSELSSSGTLKIVLNVGISVLDFSKWTRVRQRTGPSA